MGRTSAGTCRVCGIEEVSASDNVCFDTRCREGDTCIRQAVAEAEAAVPAAVDVLSTVVTECDVSSPADFEYAREVLSVRCGSKWFLGPLISEVAVLYAACSAQPSPQPWDTVVVQPLMGAGATMSWVRRCQRAEPHPVEWFELLQHGTSSEDSAVLNELALRRSALQVGPSRMVVFPWSFAPHSCAPNLVIQGANAFCARPIERYEMLTVARLRSVELRMSTTVRQEICSASLGLPQCGCVRCSARLDVGRGIKCPCGNVRFFDTQDNCWGCERCGESWTEEEMKCSGEDVLSESVYRLWMELSSADRLDKTVFKTFRDLSRKVHDVLGDTHWCSLLLAECAVMFFRHFTAKFALQTADAAQQQISKWCLRWTRLAELQQFICFCPFEAADYIESVTRLLSAPQLSARRRFLTETASHVRLSGVTLRELPEEAKESPLELIDEWETYLVARVSQSLTTGDDAGLVKSREEFLRRVGSGSHE